MELGRGLLNQTNRRRWKQNSVSFSAWLAWGHWKLHMATPAQADTQHYSCSSSTPFSVESTKSLLISSAPPCFPAAFNLKWSIFQWNYEPNFLQNVLSVVFQLLCGAGALEDKSPLLNGLVKIEATVYWACYGGVSARGIFMRYVWPGVKPGNVHDNAKSQEAS